MAVTKITYATSTGITCSLASLGSGLAQESTALDNTTNLYDDAMVYLAIKSHESTTPTGDACCYVYAYGSEDGTNYNDTCTGSNAAVTLTSPTNLRLLGTVSMPAAATTYKQIFPSVALSFGGIMPRKWGIVVKNSTGAALDATEGDHTKSYTGITWTTS